MKAKALFFIFLLGTFIGCKKDEAQPTGSAKITYTSNQSISGYSLFTEQTYDRAPALRSETLAQISSPPYVYQLIVDDLNTGTYIIAFTNGNARFTFQITGGKQREYSFR
ncbi:hypothetical protein [Siphonobacter sp.]|uniref:hypothetical protein n=1 Tax=Siphonobacter sp. TaxID=1869184 RepID=UPI003B3A27CF